MHTKLKITACNVRGINTLGKRPELAWQGEKDNIDIALLSETEEHGRHGKGRAMGKIRVLLQHRY